MRHWHCFKIEMQHQDAHQGPHKKSRAFRVIESECILRAPYIKRLLGKSMILFTRDVNTADVSYFNMWEIEVR